MRGPRLFDHTDWKSKKNLHVLRCPVFTEYIGIVKSKKKVHTSSDVLFSTESIGEEKKKVFIVRNEAPIFSEALGFSLHSLYVNPALCLQPIFSLSTCDTCPIYVGFRPTVLASSFCSPHPTNKLEDISGFKLFLGF